MEPIKLKRKRYKRYTCKACGSSNTQQLPLKRLQEQKYLYCKDCEANTPMIEYLPQKVIGEYQK